MSPVAVLVADAGPEDGLGHLSRLSAIAVALHSRRIATHCLASGASTSLERDGVAWAPWSPRQPLPSSTDVVVLDSYRIEHETFVDAQAPCVVFRDDGNILPLPSLVVSVAAPPSDAPPRLSGPRYAALRPSYWGLPRKDASGPLRRILVTTGAGDPGGIGVETAQAIASELADTEVTLVRGPRAPLVPVDGVRLVEAPDSLFDGQLAADLVVCGGGQTMLETASCGTPCLALVLAENQRDQVRRLESTGAIVVADPGDIDGALARIRDLDSGARHELSIRAQREVDGYGALRIAYHVDTLARRTR